LQIAFHFERWLRASIDGLAPMVSGDKTCAVRALLALFVRSLKEDVRGRSTYIVRGALVSLVLFFLWTTHQESRWSGAVGREFFETVIWIDMFVLSIVGLSYFASAITEEKENETLGLLRMTNLDSLSILLGKSTSRLMGALFILMAQLPFMLVAVTMGGLAVQQVLAGLVCLLGYAFFLANLGLMCSVFARKSSVATVTSGVFLILCVVVPCWLYESGALSGGSELEQWGELWAQATPLIRIQRVLATGFSGSVVDWQLVAMLTAGTLCFVMAWLMFDRFADSSDEKPGLGLVAPEASQMTPTQALAGRADTPALRWKDYHHIAGGDTAVVVKCMIAALIILACMTTLRWSGSERFLVLGWFTTVSSGLFLSLCLALDASRIFKREREQRTLSSLLMLPYSARRLAWEKTVGCLKTSWPAFTGLAIGISILAFAIAEEFSKERYWNRQFFSDTFVYFFFGCAHIVFTALLLPVFIAWLSLRMRWGALPVGGTIWFMGNWIGAVVLFIIAQQAAIVLLPLVSFCLLFGFWGSIPSKLEQLAAEE
jgi:ABC-type transport system involved in multi-copper enzyme maturation permease subunit